MHTARIWYVMTACPPDTSWRLCRGSTLLAPFALRVSAPFFAALSASAPGLTRIHLPIAAQDRSTGQSNSMRSGCFLARSCCPVQLPALLTEAFELWFLGHRCVATLRADKPTSRSRHFVTRRSQRLHSRNIQRWGMKLRVTPLSGLYSRILMRPFLYRDSFLTCHQTRTSLLWPLTINSLPNMFFGFPFLQQSPELLLLCSGLPRFLNRGRQIRTLDFPFLGHPRSRDKYDDNNGRYKSA